MTIEEIEKDINISRVSGSDIIHVSIGEFLLSQIKELEKIINGYRTKWSADEKLQERIEELEEKLFNETHESVCLKRDLNESEAKIRELDQEKNDLAGICTSAIRKRKELEEGIEKHRETSHKECHYWTPWDIELYKLIQKGGEDAQGS